MKTFWRKGLAALFALMMASAPLLGLAEESLLSRYMGQALEQGLQVDTTLGIQLGEGVQGFMAFLPEGTFDAVQKALESLKITASMANDPQGGMVAGASVSMQDTQILNARARMEPTQLRVTTNLLPGKTLVVPLEALTGAQQATPLKLDEESLAVLGKSMETYGGIVLGWVFSNPDMFVESTGNIPQSDSRDAAAGMQTLRVNGTQLKDLLVQLTTAFEQDTEFQGVLQGMVKTYGASGSVAEKAKAWAKAANELKPAQGELVLEVLTDAQGAPVECSLTMGPMFEGIDASLTAEYTRYTLDGVTHRLEGQLTGDKGEQAALKLSFDDYWDRDANAHIQELNARAMFQESASSGMREFTLANKNTIVTEEAKETEDNVLALSMTEQPAPGQSAAAASQPISLEIRSQGVTQGTGGQDFSAEQSVVISALGMEMAKLKASVAPAAYVPEDISGNQQVDLATASQEEKDALVKELEAAAQQALMQAAMLLPQELLALLSAI